MYAICTADKKLSRFKFLSDILFQGGVGNNQIQPIGKARTLNIEKLTCTNYSGEYGTRLRRVRREKRFKKGKRIR